jgi:hypothetical protein
MIPHAHCRTGRARVEPWLWTNRQAASFSRSEAYRRTAGEMIMAQWL